MTLRAPSFLRIVGVAGALAIMAGPEISMAQVGTTPDKGAPVDRALVDSGIKLTSNDAAPYDGFGTAVAISGDTVVVGAPFDDDAGVAEFASELADLINHILRFGIVGGLHRFAVFVL